MFFSSKPKSVVDADNALPGRDVPMQISGVHLVNGNKITPPFADNLEVIYLALGCFWGAERLFWELEGVHVTAVGYQGGHTKNPTYDETCSGMTGHTEAVMVVFDPSQIGLETLLKTFWEEHDPTQGMRQGNDVGTQYRSAIYTTSDAQAAGVQASRAAYDAALRVGGRGHITTEIAPAGPFYYAEEYHQQYLEKNPNGYCGLKGTGVSCPIGVASA